MKLTNRIIENEKLQEAVNKTIEVDGDRWVKSVIKQAADNLEIHTWEFDTEKEILRVNSKTASGSVNITKNDYCDCLGYNYRYRCWHFCAVQILMHYPPVQVEVEVEDDSDVAIYDFDFSESVEEEKIEYWKTRGNFGGQPLPPVPRQVFDCDPHSVRPFKQGQLVQFKKKVR